MVEYALYRPQGVDFGFRLRAQRRRSDDPHTTTGKFDGGRSPAHREEPVELAERSGLSDEGACYTRVFGYTHLEKVTTSGVI